MKLLIKLPPGLKLLLIGLPIIGGLGYYGLIVASESFGVPSSASQTTTFVSSIIGAMIVVVLLFAILSIIIESIKKLPTLNPALIPNEPERIIKNN